MTDQTQAQANAVMAIFSDTVLCDCGIEHVHGELATRSRINAWERKRQPCPCGSEHDIEIYCKCGTNIQWGPIKGWKVARRRHQLWLKREAAFLAKIAELELQLSDMA